MHFNIILLPMLKFLTWLFSSDFPTKTLYESLVSCLHTTCPAHHTSRPNIWWSVQVMKFLILQSSPISCCLIPLTFKYSCQRPVVRPLQSTGRISVCTYLDWTWGNKMIWTEWEQAFPEFNLLFATWMESWSQILKRYHIFEELLI
jgi:hypothetical protein